MGPARSGALTFERKLKSTSLPPLRFSRCLLCLPWHVVVPFDRNIVATVNLGCRLDLKTIALHARNAEYNPKVRRILPVPHRCHVRSLSTARSASRP